MEASSCADVVGKVSHIISSGVSSATFEELVDLKKLDRGFILFNSAFSSSTFCDLNFRKYAPDFFETGSDIFVKQHTNLPAIVARIFTNFLSNIYSIESYDCQKYFTLFCNN